MAAERPERHGDGFAGRVALRASQSPQKAPEGPQETTNPEGEIMHDPLVVAFEIRRPWPARRRTLTTRRLYWPPLITVWHREPGGRDSGTVCRPGTWKRHVHHWRLQIHPWQHFRRWALTRCAWCGGRSRKNDRANFGTSWDGVRSRWWRGEAGLMHSDCHTVWGASRRCLCDDPVMPPVGYGTCARCSKFRAWGADVSEADRLLAGLPEGDRIPVEMRPALEAIWDARLVVRGVDPETTIKPWRTER